MKRWADNELMPTGDELCRLVAVIATDRDRQAFALLFKHFAPRLKTYLMRFGTMANSAEEIAQEAMLTVWRKAGSFDPSRGGASTWVFTIARNLRIDHQRRDRRPENLVVDPSEEPDHPPTTETLMIGMERDARVRAALHALSDEQASIVRLSFLSDKPHAEIARELGLPLGTVKSRIRLAMNRLRTLLDDTL